MNTDIRQKRELWRQAFGDTEEFLDAFFSKAYDPRRCDTIYIDGTLACAAYWFDCLLDGKKAAYLYALATRPEYRGRGLAHRLTQRIGQRLKAEGYCAVILVPGSESLFRFYERMDYRVFGCVREFSCKAAGEATALRRVDREEYARLRRELLAQGAVVQEDENLRLLDALAQLYAGEGLLLACSREGDTLHALELLGNADAAPGILKTLGCETGTFRVPGKEKPFAMWLKLADCRVPEYFGLAFD